MLISHLRASHLHASHIVFELFLYHTFYDFLCRVYTRSVLLGSCVTLPNFLLVFCLTSSYSTLERLCITQAVLVYSCISLCPILSWPDFGDFPPLSPGILLHSQATPTVIYTCPVTLFTFASVLLTFISHTKWNLPFLYHTCPFLRFVSCLTILFTVIFGDF